MSEWYKDLETNDKNMESSHGIGGAHLEGVKGQPVT